MSNKQDISQTVRQFILENVFGGNENSDLKSDTSLISSRLMDSIVALKLVTFLENKYGIEFEAHEVSQDNLDSIDRVSDFVLSKMK
ncbi:MAG: acyl carrier protein [Bacteroidia bacterium]|nr:acyl carrier protein [Bacteroidia bacterium]